MRWAPRRPAEGTPPRPAEGTPRRPAEGAPPRGERCALPLAPLRAGRLEARSALGLAAGGAVLLLFGLTFGATPLLVPGVGFVLLGAAAPAWVTLAGHDARIGRRLERHRLTEGSAVVATIRVRRGHLGLPGGVITDPLAGAEIPIGADLAPLGGARSVDVQVIARLPRRGRHHFAAPALAVADPLGLVRLCRPGPGSGDEVLVLPRTEPVRWLRPEHRRLAAGETSSSSHEPMGAGEVDGLRAYQPGTSAARIHWPALARGAGLLERRLVSEPDCRPLIVLDARCADATAGEEALDAAVRATGSLVLELARQGGCGLLLPGARLPVAIAPDLAAWSAVHTRLALVERPGQEVRVPSLRPDTARGPVVWVTAGPHPGPAAARHASRFVLVVPLAFGAHPDQRASFEVSGCAGYVLGGTRAGRRAA